MKKFLTAIVFFTCAQVGFAADYNFKTMKCTASLLPNTVTHDLPDNFYHNGEFIFTKYTKTTMYAASKFWTKPDPSKDYSGSMRTAFVFENNEIRGQNLFGQMNDSLALKISSISSSVLIGSYNGGCSGAILQCDYTVTCYVTQ